MNVKMLLLSAMVLVGCHRQGALQIGDMREQWLLADSKQREEAAKRDDAVASLRTDLSAPWTSLIVASRYDCTCTGTSYTGFKIVRESDTFTVAPWLELGGSERFGESRILSRSGAEQLLSEIPLYYLAATLSVDPLEKVGHAPQNPAQFAEWRKAYLAAGGPVEGGDHIWIEIRIATRDTAKKHSDMFDRYVPSDFWQWILAFGKVKETP
jgi:hypothetical protein